MKFGKLSIFFLVLLLVTAQFTVSSGIQDQISDKTEAPETATADSSLEGDIFNNPLKPPDTSSPRATLQSFLCNINRAYGVLMAGHQKNMNEPGLFASKSIARMERKRRLPDSMSSTAKSYNFPIRALAK